MRYTLQITFYNRQIWTEDVKTRKEAEYYAMVFSDHTVDRIYIIDNVNGNCSLKFIRNK
jgi:hypothetical protein